MREILFRGKTYDGEWVEGFLFNSQLCRIFWATAFKKEEDNMFYCEGKDVNPETIGQFTGLTDKNGKKIFEGDIVRYTRTNMYCPEASFHKKDLVSLHLIYFDNKNYSFFQKHYNLESQRIIGYGSITFNDDRAKENIIEVIGNIHDNPELLEVQDEHKSKM